MNPFRRNKLKSIYTLAENVRELDFYLGFRPQNVGGIKIKNFDILKDEKFRDFIQLFKRGYHIDIDLKDTGESLWALVRHNDLKGIVDTSFMMYVAAKDRRKEKDFRYSLFKFKGKYNLYFVFRYDSCKFYPFIPLDRDSKLRHVEEELKIASLLGKKIPIEKSPKKWEPIWDVPI